MRNLARQKIIQPNIIHEEHGKYDGLRSKIQYKFRLLNHFIQVSHSCKIYKRFEFRFQVDRLPFQCCMF